MPESNPTPLSAAPPEVQLAVELILLLEQQQLPIDTVLAALSLVQRDFQRQARELTASNT